MDDPRLPVLILGSYAFAEEVDDLISETSEWPALSRISTAAVAG